MSWWCNLTMETCSIHRIRRTGDGLLGEKRARREKVTALTQRGSGAENGAKASSSPAHDPAAESIGPRPTCFLVGVPGHSAVAVDLVDASFSLPSQLFGRQSPASESVGPRRQGGLLRPAAGPDGRATESVHGPPTLCPPNPARASRAERRCRRQSGTRNTGAWDREDRRLLSYAAPATRKTSRFTTDAQPRGNLLRRKALFPKVDDGLLLGSQHGALENSWPGGALEKAHRPDHGVGVFARAADGTTARAGIARTIYPLRSLLAHFRRNVSRNLTGRDNLWARSASVAAFCRSCSAAAKILASRASTQGLAAVQ